jgi:DNA mismatch endonuclease (patch repair protein)
MPAPRFDKFQASSQLASRIKARVRHRDTRAELALRSAIHKLGLRYRLHVPDLPGRPDLVFRRARLAVFVDGDYWHGRGWRQRRKKLAVGSNAAYWLKKIQANRTRDRRQDRLLQESGWSIVRLWETDVLKDPDKAAAIIRAHLQTRGHDIQNVRRKSTRQGAPR